VNLFRAAQIARPQGLDQGDVFRVHFLRAVAQIKPQVEDARQFAER
jgi:hypothetical protein